MTSSNPSPTPPAQSYTVAPGRGHTAVRRAALLTVLAILLTAAFVAGAMMHDRLGALVGRDRSPGVADAGGPSTQLWTCGMHPQVIQDHPGTCPICHMELTPLRTDADAEASSGERTVKYWWDPMMNPPYISDQPGKSPMGMDLVPVYEDEVMAGPAVTIDPVVVQNMGVRTAPVERASIQQQIRAVGYLEEPEPLHRDVNLRVSGWIEKLYADTDGMPIEKGQPLFELYSPEIQVAVEELIAARKSLEAVGDEQAKRVAQTLYQATARKLELWGLDKAQVEQLAKRDRAPGTVTFAAPIGGHLTEKRVYEGAGVEAGMMVMRLADRNRMWVDAQVYEQQLPLVQIGAKARATVVSEPGKVLEGEVIFIHPHIDPMTRTALIRVQIPNEDYRLRQGMYATVDILAEPPPPAPVVPREAIIDTGTRQIAFVALGGGRFEPREVKLGLSGDDGLVQVLSGLAPGEQVVTSGQFLLDSESRLKEAIQKHLSAKRVGAQSAPPPAAQAQRHAPRPPETSAVAPTAAPSGLLDVPHVDEIAVAYLEVAQALGARQQADNPIGVDRLVDVARKSVEHATDEGKALAAAVLKAAEGMKGKPIADQRRAFQPLSDAVIALLERSPQSKAVANELYVVHCPMAFDDAGADWVQSVPQVANPYYATQMKSCGEVTRTIAAKK